MMYYRHNEDYYITEKSESKLTGDNVAWCEEDFDLGLYGVRIGYLDNTNQILRYTKKLKPAEQVEKYMNEIRSQVAELEETVSLLNDVLLEQMGL